MHQFVFSIGRFNVPSYGMMMALGFIISVFISIRLGKMRGISAEAVSDMICWVMISGILGARAAHVVANYGRLYAGHPLEMLFIWKGGLVYYGGLAGAIAGMALFARVRKARLLELYDLVATVLPLGHAFGRIGCFLNGCCHGTLCDLPIAVTFPPGTPAAYCHEDAKLVRYGGASLPVHPVQLYEAALNVILFIVLTWLFRRSVRSGTVGASYLVGYSVIRFGLEFWRGDARMMAGRITVAQVISVVMFIIGISFLIFSRIRERANTSSAV